MLKGLRKQHGTMLINVLVGIGIMLVMATLTIPYLRQFQPNLKLSGAAQDLASDLKYAQQLTITERVIHGIYIDEVNDSYQIYRINPPAATSTVKSVTLSADINISDVNGFTGNLVKFNSYGSVSESGDIVLSNINNASSTIRVKPSGFIQIIR